ncbi:MAG: hypothetical protein H3C28_02915 [Sphingomonadales bacterium]|nr:hypothetical protein [Sphingomonadales bacterium]
MTEILMVRLDPAFPLRDVEEIGHALTISQALIPGYVPPTVGLLDLRALFYMRNIGGFQTIVLPDRNIVSRIAKVAEQGVKHPFDKPTNIAVHLMAFCQCMNINIEPSIAFHELAHYSGNEIAHYELSWFRAADKAQAQAWVDIALGRRDRLAATGPDPISTKDLAYPLKRWTRNYIAALKVAELELYLTEPLERAIALLDWMYDDFFLAGPAAAFASMYFSPRAAKKRLIKHLRSPDREKAIAGIKNAAWDMTHLSEFARRVSCGEAEGRRYIFATADLGLASIAPLLMLNADDNNLASTITQKVRSWWSSKEAATLADDISFRIRNTSSRPPPSAPAGMKDPLTTWINTGEKVIRGWKSG